MAGLHRRGKRVLEEFKAFANSSRRYDRGRPLAAHANAEMLLYAMNPVYIESTQGGTSASRGFGAFIWIAGMMVCVFGGIFGIYLLGQAGESVGAGMSLLLFVMSVVVLVGSIIPGLMAYLTFFAPTDAVVRFDRKRQMAYMPAGKRLLEIPWSRLTPVVQGMAASPMLPARMYRGLFVEYGADHVPLVTEGVPHVLQVGQASGGEPGALFSLEYVRRYMDEGPESVPRPNRDQWLHHRPDWRAMFNFVHLVDGWMQERHARSEAAPWAQTVVFALMFPLMFLLQVTHWLALRVAPLPKWPKALQAQHAADLAELGLRPDGQPVGSPAGGTDLRAPAQGWKRIAPWIAVPLALLSPVVFWGSLLVLLPVELGLKQATLLSVAMGIAATAITVLSLPEAHETAV